MCFDGYYNTFPAGGKLNGDDFRARILARKSARMSVSVSLSVWVSVSWNLS